jgi:hypothetical protein
MATDKKKEVKMKDLKPNKDAKGGVARQTNSQRGANMNRGGGQMNKGGGNLDKGGGRLLS